MPSKKLKTPLIPGSYYHIYNRGNNREKLFYHNNDYYYFLTKYKQIVAPTVNTYAFCLMPNHFHFLISVKGERENKKMTTSNQLRKLFIMYTQRINSLQQRSGSLFTKNFQRIEVKDLFYLKTLVIYIHRNPIRHGLMIDFQNYNFSSMDSYISNKSTQLLKSEVIEWFGGKEEFLTNHFSTDESQPEYDVHYLEEDGVPGSEMESLPDESKLNLSTAFF